VVSALCALLVPGVAVAAFPGPESDPSVRANTPNDPDFDKCEPDDEDTVPAENDCKGTFDQQYERFGFAPKATETTALYKDSHPRLEGENTAAGRFPKGQVPGVAADRAWKYTPGRGDVEIAILDTGIRWGNSSLRKRIALNAEELPTPACDKDDCNGDGVFNAQDWAGQVAPTAGHDEADGFLDASDLLATFSNGQDDDLNGYVDDIAGWDFFDDDNDAYDASSYSSASNHGTGRAEDAAEEGDDGAGSIGVCPRCTIVPLRIWDTFVVDTNQFALGVTYAADNGIEVVEAAIGGLLNSHFARDAVRDAYERGVFMAVVSSDLNTADHNFPTFYDEALQVQGTVADVHGLDGSSGAEVGDFFAGQGLPLGGPVQTWFRNSGTTQYGGHAHVVMPGVTGSQATGQASGAAGLVAAYAREENLELEPNEIKQILTMTAQDVTPENTVGTGTPDPAQVGWDQHFGYGLPDLGAAMEAIRDDKIPPQGLITSPAWFEPYEAGRVDRVEIAGRVSAPRSGGYSWVLEWAPGIEQTPLSSWTEIGTGMGSAPFEGKLGEVDIDAVRAALDALPQGGAAVDPTAPAKGSPTDTDPNEPAFTVRLRITDAAGNKGEDRKMLFAHRDATLADGWPKRLQTGGEASQRLWDVDGDRRLDVVLADSSGALHVFDSAGRAVEAFNDGQPVLTQTAAAVHPQAPAFTRVQAPREPLRTPAIGDVDGDMAADIVDSAGEHVYAWHMDGTPVTGFPVRIDPDLSRPADRTRQNHIKRGFMASPVLADLDPGRPGLEIVIGALDQHLYAFNGAGQPLTGFPLKLRDPALPGAEIITTPAVGELVPGGRPEIVTATQEFDEDPTAPACDDVPTCLLGGFTQILANALGGSGRTYAVGHDEADGKWKVLPGWPISPNGAVPDALPFVAPGIEHVLGDVDADGAVEVIGGVATGDTQAYGADGVAERTYDPSPGGGEHVDKSKVLNLFEYPVAADLDGLPGLEVIKGGLTLNGLVNLGVAVGQNLPYNHVVQAWNGQSGASLPSYPQAVEDYQLLSSPAVADAADSAGAEIIVGTGLYLLRSLNAAGLEGAGFPKFTGGWLFAVPALGDVDGDGRLDIFSMTREGNAFLWKGTQDACAGNDQWWTSRHDERSTGAYGTDTRPPHAPADLTAADSAAGVRFVWKRPGDDWSCGTPEKYRVVTSDGPIDSPSDGTVLEEQPAGAATAAVELPRSSLRKDVAVFYADDSGNWGAGARVSVPAEPVQTPTPTTDPPTETPTPTPTDGPTQSLGGPPTGTPTVGPDGGGIVLRDTAAPSVVVDASRYGTSTGRFLVRFNASESAVFEVAVRRLPATTWKVIAESTRATSLRYRGVRGQSYEVRVRAVDAAGNRSKPAYRRVVVPLDQTAARIVFDSGWARSVRRERAFGGTVASSRLPGAKATLTFRGRGVRVFVAALSKDLRARLPRQLRVTLDGHSRTVTVRGRGGVRGRPAFSGTGLNSRRSHRLVLEARDARVLVDAIAVLR
jgi:hypothetical protein